MSLPKKYIILHHTLTNRDKTTFQAVDNYHRNLWNKKSSLGYYLGYHYFINFQGKVYQARNDWEIGIHCYQDNKNLDSIGICLAGNFDQEKPSQKQLNSLKKLVQDLIDKYNIVFNNLKFHRDYANYKSCPGNNIKNDFYYNLLNKSNMLKLIQKKEDNEVYVLDKYNRRHSMLNWDTFQRGITMGLWNGEIEIVNDLDQYPLGDIIILVPDN